MGAANSDGIRVLHVDDDPDATALAREFLSRQVEALSVVEETRAEDALDRLDEGPVDCVVSDYDLAETDGLALLRAVRERHPELPFVLFTGTGSEDVASEAITAGVTDYVRKDGSERQHLVLANRIVRAVEEYRARREAESSKRRFRALIEQSTDSIAVLDESGVIQYQSPTIEEIAGHDPEEMVGTSAFDYVHPEDRERVAEKFYRSLEEPGRTPTDRYRFRHADGSWIYLESSGNNRLDDPDVEGFVLNSRDVTDRMHRERELRASKRRIEALHDVAIDIEACETEREVCRLTVEAAEEVLAFDSCVVSLARDGYLHVEAASAEVPPDQTGRMSVDEGLAGESYRTGDSSLVADLSGEPAAEPRGDYRSAITVPIGDVGVLQAVAGEVGFFDEEDLELAELLSAHASQALSRVRSERTVREERDKLAAFFEHIPEPAVETEFDGDELVVRAVNSAFEETFGYDASEVRGKCLDDFIVPADRTGEATAFNRRVRAGEQVEAEVRRLTADGPREFLLRTAPFAPDGSLNYAVYTDITARKEYERELGALHETMRGLIKADSVDEVARGTVEASRDILGLPHSGFFQWNETTGHLEPVATTDEAADVIGPPPRFERGEGIAGWAFDRGETVVLDDAQGDDRALDSGSPAIRSYCVIPLGERGVLTIAAPEPGEFDERDLELAGILAANAEAALGRAERELTLQERERELQRQNERLEEFAGVVSHDLRGPLSVASGRIELAREDRDDDENLAHAERALDRMEELIDDVLALAREGRIVSETEPVALADVVETTRRTAGLDADQLVVDGDLPTVEADPERLRSVLENLFRNAVEHGSTGPRSEPGDAVEHGSTSPRSEPGDAVEHGSTGSRTSSGEDGQGRELSVRVGPLPDGFYVADDGPGIPAGERENVFDLGYTTSDDGTGFGLSIVEQVVSAHGWSVSVSESPEGGACFEITGVELD